MQLIDELLPVVIGAPNLGGHNRSGESIKATKAKQKMQQLQPGTNDAALAHRAGPASGNVAQVPNASGLHTAPHDVAWGQAPLLVRVWALPTANRRPHQGFHSCHNFCACQVMYFQTPLS